MTKHHWPGICVKAAGTLSSTDSPTHRILPETCGIPPTAAEVIVAETLVSWRLSRFEEDEGSGLVGHCGKLPRRCAHSRHCSHSNAQQRRRAANAATTGQLLFEWPLLSPSKSSADRALRHSPALAQVQHEPAPRSLPSQIQRKLPASQRGPCRSAL